jgi:RNA recognition motif-containing protein
VKNLPEGCTHHELQRILNEVGLDGLYNFIYVPFDFKKSVVFRYGFVNFEQHEQAVRAMAILEGFSGWVVDGEKGCEVEFSGAQQSLHALVERYRNSPVMHASVPVAFKPLLFEKGVSIAFPLPTKAVNPPKHMDESAVQAPLQAEKVEAPARDSRTTVIVKNLPEGYTHEELRRILDEVGLGGLYNFIYVPFDFKKSAMLRYGFVNFEQNEHAVKAMAILDGFSGLVINGEKCCEVEWGDAQQSLHANIDRYKNSPLMHGSVPDAYKPVLFTRGVRTAFPAPTKVVKPLKLRKVSQS